MDYSLRLLISYILLCRYNVVFHLHYILGRRGDVKMCSVLKCNNNVFHWSETGQCDQYT